MLASLHHLYAYLSFVAFILGLGVREYVYIACGCAMKQPQYCAATICTAFIHRTRESTESNILNTAYLASQQADHMAHLAEH